MDARQNADIELRAKLASQGANVDWRTMPIGGHSPGCLLDDVARHSGSWWKRENPTLKAVTAFLSRDGHGPDQEEYGRPEAQLSAVVKSQRDKEKHGKSPTVDEAEEWESYLPAPNDNMAKWADALATKINCNLPETKPWYQTLRTLVGKYPANAIGRDVDADALRMLVRMIYEGAHHE